MGSAMYDKGKEAIRDAIIRGAILWLRDRAAGVDPDSPATQPNLDAIMFSSVADLFEAVVAQRDVLRELAEERLLRIQLLTALRGEHPTTGG